MGCAQSKSVQICADDRDLGSEVLDDDKKEGPLEEKKENGSEKADNLNEPQTENGATTNLNENEENNNQDENVERISLDQIDNSTPAGKKSKFSCTTFKIEDEDEECDN